MYHFGMIESGIENEIAAMRPVTNLGTECSQEQRAEVYMDTMYPGLVMNINI